MSAGVNSVLKPSTSHLRQRITLHLERVAMTNTAYQQPAYQQQYVPARNGFATAALILGIVGFILTPIPLFIGLVLGGIPNLLATAFGIAGIVKSRKLNGKGLVPSIIAIILSFFAGVAILFGAGIVW